MTVTVLLFASYADLLGRSDLELALEPGATVADALVALAKVPGGERLPESPLVAVNERYASTDLVLRPRDEVALIPPVAGG